MKYLKTSIVLVIAILALTSCKQEEQTILETQDVETVDIAAETEAVTLVMKSYKDAIQNLTTEGTLELFTEEAVVFESGGSEGTYKNYEGHHLGPELKVFNSFIFSDYKIDVNVDLPFAFVNETYIYTIDLRADEEKGREARIIKKKGVATSVLKKIDGVWKITKTHSSSRGIKSSH